MNIIATIKRSAGNDTIGDMWQETAVFDSEDKIEDVFQWCNKRMHSSCKLWEYQNMDNIVLSLAQTGKEEEEESK